MNFLIRGLDVLFALLGLIILSPIMLLIAVLIKITSKGPIVYVQKRVGKNNVDFNLYKFRSMYVDAHKKQRLTVGGRDSRITPIGYFLRKYKLDELPQLVNVLVGEMSIVGPRPELRWFVNMYNAEQKKILLVKPGITDYASLMFKNENELLATAKDPESYYIEEVMPHKIVLNNYYINNRNIKTYLVIILKTAMAVFK
jgi:lipopolysaccharide/colanic/teichoic acid biosynthesis glycosyltransferase